MALIKTSVNAKKSVNLMVVMAVIGVACTVAIGTIFLIKVGIEAAGAPDMGWYANNPNAEIFEISTANELAGLAQIVNGTWGGTPERDDFSGKTIRLTNNIDLSTYDNWTPIGSITYDKWNNTKSTVMTWDWSNEKPFAGTFDGGGHIISKTTDDNHPNSEVDNQNLFGYIQGGSVKNLRLDGMNIRDGRIINYEFFDFFTRVDSILADKRPTTQPTAQPATDNKNLSVIITNSIITFSSKSGHLSRRFYKEFHRYITRDGLDTLVEHIPGEMPVNPETGRELTIHERLENHLYLYLLDRDRSIAQAMYTRFGEMLTNINGFAVQSVTAGDMVYAPTNPRRMIVVSNTDDFESRPLSAYDEFKTRLMFIRERYRGAPDADDIIITAENSVTFDKILRIMNLARATGYSNISIALLSDSVRKRTQNDPIREADVFGKDIFTMSTDSILSLSRPGRINLLGSGLGRNYGALEGLLDGLRSGPAPELKKRWTPVISSSRLHTTAWPLGGGGRSRVSVQRVIMQNMAELRHAYNRRLRENPALMGRITVKISIDESGKVISAQMVETTINDRELENFVVDRVKSWNFGPIDKPGDVAEVTYPFVFSQ
ncbi:MAG: TonB family protein [Chitinispirillales bacterium]|jgi:TonB family protein|nr:TonB family protein [Chitinispirillales bacterium]